MGAHKRTPVQIDKDRTEVAEMFVRAVPVRQIAIRLNKMNAHLGYSLSFQQIYQDITVITKNWQQERTAYIDRQVSMEVAKINAVENAAWDAWERSVDGRKKTEITGGRTDDEGRIIGGEVNKRTKESSAGDGRYLMIVLTCVKQRAELLGIIEQKLKVSGSITVGSAIETMDENDIRKELSIYYRRGSTG